MIFHDLRLPIPNGNNYFQIDTLLLSSHFALIIEVKNIAGSLLFDKSFHQLIRTSNGIEEGLPDPLTQVQRQRLELTKWLVNHNFTNVEIEYLVVISNSATILKAPGYPQVKRRVCHAKRLLHKIEEFETLYPNETISSNEIKKLKRLLVKNHTIPEVNIEETYRIKPAEIITGVLCPSCFSLPMARKRGVWLCPYCRTFSKDAHIQAINDYFLLINSTITNHQFREFLQLLSRETAKKLLISMNLPCSGSNKGRIYFRPPL